MTTSEKQTVILLKERLEQVSSLEEEYLDKEALNTIYELQKAYAIGGHELFFQALYRFSI